MVTIICEEFKDLSKKMIIEVLKIKWCHAFAFFIAISPKKQQNNKKSEIILALY